MAGETRDEDERTQSFVTDDSTNSEDHTEDDSRLKRGLIECAQQGRLATSERLDESKIAGDRGLLIRDLRRAQKKLGYLPLTLANYFQELRQTAFSKAVTTEEIEKAFGLTDGWLKNLKRPTRDSVEAGRLLGLDQQFIRNALRYECVSMCPAVQTLAKHDRGASNVSLEDVCERLEENIEFALKECPEHAEAVKECEQALNGLLV